MVFVFLRAFVFLSAMGHHGPYAKKLDKQCEAASGPAEDNELPGAAALLQLLQSEISIRSYPTRTVSPHAPRKIRYVLERMSLSNLVSIVASTLPGRFPKLMSNELGHLRETARVLN